MSAAELAARVGVTRQTIYAIEQRRFIPNTAVSLRLARVLGVSVEDIFAVDDDPSPEPGEADLLSDGPLRQGQLVELCSVNRHLVAVPVLLTPAYLPLADASVVRRVNRRVTVQSAAPAPENGNRLLIAGCDPALSLLGSALRRSGLPIIIAPGSSRRALEYLKQDRVHVAGSHILDRTTGDYNVPIVRRMLPGKPVRVVTFASWEQGLVLAAGNPKHIRSLADVARPDVTIINRELGSGSRDLLDAELARLGIKSGQVKGYRSLAAGHLAAARAVAAGQADCCISPHSVARLFGLRFVPLAIQRFDLSFHKTTLDLPAAKDLLDVLNRSSLRNTLRGIAGYDTTQTGEFRA